MLRENVLKRQADSRAAVEVARQPLLTRATSGVLVAQLGARRHYAVPRVLWHAGLLERLVTDFCADAQPWAAVKRFLPPRALPVAARRLLQRTPGDIPSARIVSLSAFAVDPRLRRQQNEPLTDLWARRNAAFGREVARRGFGEAGIVYAFNGAALEIFRAAKAVGCRTVLDQTAAPWRWNSVMLKEEAERWPGWEPQPAEIDASGELMAREEAEWNLADSIVVGSDFARSALAETGGPAHRAETVPYPAIPEQVAAPVPYPRQFGQQRKLRVLFLGTLQLRKGIQYLDQAARSLQTAPMEFRLVGSSHLSEKAHRQLADMFDIRGPVPRSEIAEHLCWADVMVLPTLSEGSANVCYEAVAAGVPVMTTPCAGSVLEDGVSGLIVPARSAEAITRVLLRLSDQPSLLQALADGARTAMRQRSFEIYSSELIEAVQRSPVKPVSATYSL